MYGRNNKPPIAYEELNSIYGNKATNTPPTTKAIKESKIKSLPIYSKIRSVLNRRTIPNYLTIQSTSINTKIQSVSNEIIRNKNDITIIETPKKYKV